MVGGTVAQLAAASTPLVAVEPIAVRGKSTAVPVWRLDPSAPALRSPAPRAALVGRDDDLADLVRMADRVVRRRDSCLLTVLGSAGIGKSRLVSDFASGLDGWRTLEGSCPSYTSGATFWPLAQMLEQLGEDWPAQVSMLLGGDRDAPLIGDRLATAVGASDDVTSLDDIVWAVRRLVEALAIDRPVLLVFEDLHWAEPTFIEFIDRLSARLRNVPALIVCLSRPELLEAYPMWGGGRSFSTTMELGALASDSVRQLIGELTADVVGHAHSALAEWEPEVDRLIAVSEGNPLVVQQLLRFGATGQDMPVSLKTLFEARLDQLDPADRVFCECAAVMGREFWAAAVRTASDLNDMTDGDWQATLQRLERLDILQPTRARNGGRPGHRFTHTLLMETIYGATPKSLRSRSHGRVASWLSSAPGLGAGERSELVAFHLERAHSLLSEISREDAQAPVLAAAAGEAAALASAHCLARSDLPAAVRMLTQAQRLLPVADKRHYDVARWLFDCLMSMGSTQDAAGALDRTDELLRDDPVWALLGPVPRAALGLRREQVTRADAHEVARRLISGLAADSVPGALFWAYELEALAFSAGMQMSAAERSAHMALGYARAAGDRRAESRLLCGLCEMAFWGHTPVAEARALCQSSLALIESDLQLTAPVLAMLAALHAMEGDHTTAGDLLRRSHEITVDLELPGSGLACASTAAWWRCSRRTTRGSAGVPGGDRRDARDRSGRGVVPADGGPGPTGSRRARAGARSCSAGAAPTCPIAGRHGRAALPGALVRRWPRGSPPTAATRSGAGAGPPGGGVTAARWRARAARPTRSWTSPGVPGPRRSRSRRRPRQRGAGPVPAQGRDRSGRPQWTERPGRSDDRADRAEAHRGAAERIKPASRPAGLERAQRRPTADGRGALARRGQLRLGVRRRRWRGGAGRRARQWCRRRPSAGRSGGGVGRRSCRRRRCAAGYGRAAEDVGRPRHGLCRGDPGAGARVHDRQRAGAHRWHLWQRSGPAGRSAVGHRRGLRRHQPQPLHQQAGAAVRAGRTVRQRLLPPQHHLLVGPQFTHRQLPVVVFLRHLGGQQQPRDRRRRWEGRRHNYNPAPPAEFFAPGVGVRGGVVGPHRSIRAAGNSFATPYVSGLCAQILGKHPGITPFQVKHLLFSLRRMWESVVVDSMHAVTVGRRQPGRTSPGRCCSQSSKPREPSSAPRPARSSSWTWQPSRSCSAPSPARARSRWSAGGFRRRPASPVG